MNPLCKHLLALILVAGSATAIAQTHSHSMPGMDMPEAKEDGKSQDSASNAADHVANHDMSRRHMDMGPHMYMTKLRAEKPGDKERAAGIVLSAKQAMDHYKDYKVALDDGFKIFLPDVPQKMYHFTSLPYAREAATTFNPEHPTSLLYEKQGDGYKLIGAMYTAPAKMTEDAIDKRVPLSVTQWHKHVNRCAPPPDKKSESFGKNPRFGLAGSITTREECESAGGEFQPTFFGWMVHVYPYEKSPEDIWSAERQHDDGIDKH